jgi:hypothetical protein
MIRFFSITGHTGKERQDSHRPGGSLGRQVVTTKPPASGLFTGIVNILTRCRPRLGDDMTGHFLIQSNILATIGNLVKNQGGATGAFAARFMLEQGGDPAPPFPSIFCPLGMAQGAAAKASGLRSLQGSLNTFGMERETKRMGCATFGSSAVLPATDEVKLHILFLSCVRFVVEKHGGTMATDPHSLDAQLDIPENTKDACFEELGELLNGSCLAARQHQIEPYTGGLS